VSGVVPTTRCCRSVASAPGALFRGQLGLGAHRVEVGPQIGVDRLPGELVDVVGHDLLNLVGGDVLRDHTADDRQGVVHLVAAILVQLVQRPGVQLTVRAVGVEGLVGQVVVQLERVQPSGSVGESLQFRVYLVVLDELRLPDPPLVLPLRQLQEGFVDPIHQFVDELLPTAVDERLAQAPPAHHALDGPGLLFVLLQDSRSLVSTVQPGVDRMVDRPELRTSVLALRLSSWPPSRP
jgi:hypothetical protein